MNDTASNMTMNFEQWYEKLIRACESHDSDLAFSAWRKWDEMIAQAPASSKDEVMGLKEKLLFTAFPSLPVNQAVEIIEKQLLNLIGSDVDVDEVIHNRFLYLGYGNQEGDRKAFHTAILKNKQKLGEKTVAEWIQAFDTAFPSEDREETVVAEFFTRIPNIVSMSKTEQNFLRILLRVYDQWFAAPLSTIYDTAVVYKKLNELEKSGVKEINTRTFQAQYLSSASGSRSDAPSTTDSRSAQKNISLPLLQALSKYENLGNQLITGERIKIKSQGEPVRPSLLYWLRYYRDELGIGQHNSVDRGQFLFRSENGKKLSHEERERLSLILKSIEENFPLQIDTERQEIVFPVFQAVVMPPQTTPQNVLGKETAPVISKPTISPSSERPAFFQPQDMSKKNMSGSMHISPGLAFSNPREKEIGKIRPITPQSAGEVSFSANHFFPAEKEVIEKKAETVQEKAVEAPKPGAPVSPPTPPLPKITPVVPRTNAFNIRPVSFGRKD
jgi:hypothetical protein